MKKIISHLRQRLHVEGGYKGQVANFQRLMFRDRQVLDAAYGQTVVNGEIDDRSLVARICAAYARHATEETGRSMWSDYFAFHHADVNRVLLAGDQDAATRLMRNPALSNILYGFDILNRDYIGYFKSRRVQEAYADLCLDGMVRLAEATGAVPLENPEVRRISATAWNAESVIARLQSRLGWRLDAPNPYPSEPGLESGVGVVSYRVPQAVFQAIRIQQLVGGTERPRVVEIGAGLGRTAYYAHRLGIVDYTIVDLPVSCAAQAYFLGRVFGDAGIHLEGEPDTGDLDRRVKIISPAAFRKLDQRFDLVANFDSFTEMDAAVAAAYWEKSKSLAKAILSVNHEANPHRVHDLFANDHTVVSRERLSYWMRRGYVEEIIRWN